MYDHTCFTSQRTRLARVHSEASQGRTFDVTGGHINVKQQAAAATRSSYTRDSITCCVNVYVYMHDMITNNMNMIDNISNTNMKIISTIEHA